MRHHALTHHAGPFSGNDPKRAGLVHLVVDRFLLLPIGALIALVWANTSADSYFTFSHALAFPVNEIGMTLFFALIAQEIVEAVMPGGALHTWRRWGMPVVAAAGGMLGAALTYLAYVHWHYELVLSQAWPVACAVDMAAAYFVLKIVCRRAGVASFLLLLAIATNAAGLVFVALQHVTLAPRAGGAAALMIGALGLAALMRRVNVRAFWPYLVICGAMSWAAFWAEGMHPALALVPIVPFLPHEPRREDLFADPADDDATHHAEHEWHYIVQGVLFLFGLVNAGVLLQGYGTGTWAILLAALVGRPLGILLMVGLGLLAGLHLPAKMGLRELIVVALVTSSGFTFALFFATGILPIGPVLAEIKLGALSTVGGAAVAIGAARMLRVGRFAHGGHTGSPFGRARMPIL